MIFFTGLVSAEQPQPERLDAVLEPIRVANNLPALAAVVVRGGDTVAIGAVGFRKKGAPDLVTVNDEWHIGSCTKSMTAVLAAMLVEDGTWRWDTTLADMFPKLALEMRPGWRDVTLEELLTHHGGAPPDLNENGLWGRLWDRVALPPIKQRDYLTRELLTRQSPSAPPGTKFIYSNAGYALVGHAIETQLGQPWEDVIRERLFKPLGMDSAGFGAAGTIGTVDEPWGHGVGGKPIPPGLQADNPAAIGPAGAVHCSIGDLAKYAAFQMRGDRGEGTLLKPETFKKLHTVFGRDGDYACGWIVTQRPWGGGEVLTHMGSNTYNVTVIWLAPKKNFAVVVSTNLGGQVAEKAADEAAGALIQKFLVRQ
jgi:CubicO group peptidase (beta-lactamase class C family)